MVPPIQYNTFHFTSIHSSIVSNGINQEWVFVRWCKDCSPPLIQISCHAWHAPNSVLRIQIKILHKFGATVVRQNSHYYFHDDRLIDWFDSAKFCFHKKFLNSLSLFTDFIVRYFFVSSSCSALLSSRIFKWETRDLIFHFFHCLSQLSSLLLHTLFPALPFIAWLQISHL